MKVTLQPSGHIIEMQPGERILDAARRLGYDVPQSCRNGNCHVCAADLLAGTVHQGDADLIDGQLFTCISEPLSDCTLHWEGVLAPGEMPLRDLACQLIEAEPMGADVWRVRLRTPAGKPMRFHAGQYLLLDRPDGEASAFSIASAPFEERVIELHILAREHSTIALVEHIRRERLARIKGPFGDCHLAKLPERPLVLIAAGTGLAQMQSMIQECLREGFDYPVHLYWGVREAADFYAAPYWEEWKRSSNIYMHQIVSDEPDWPGRQGMLTQAVVEDLANLADYEFYASGSPAMVYATLDALMAAGMPEQQMLADVFAYAPRG
ncbi:MAG TPA: 2Fe-2S iron-sulfur cluster binding domain-containing protein [Pseudomonas xinjiangensis]|uniref:2Fe-2S iron-sulfur cluster binding domain-containing protein n=2 Tax=root TaxID=1 RepID=A0A7V1BM02_9GAMM|nr:2Fe-2S iron-sulfur cluster binding domain-containing protein [Halopseudomonas xinjiangensis]HEC46134.1 2Fe-2S iron-sulfur cluster binding domain-containing protein [Halopseudomonas xinjiangensis]